MAVSPSPNDLTRQQLDELDALLQRMLALPVSSPEPALAFPPPPPLPELPPAAPRPALRAAPEPAVGWRADSPAGGKSPHQTPAPEPAVAFAPTVLPFPSPAARSQPQPDPMPALRPAPPPPLEPPVVVVSPGTLRGVDAPALPFDFRRADPTPLPPNPPVEFPEVNPFADPPPAVVEAKPLSAARPVPVYLWPVFALNWVLEFLLGWFGPIGAAVVRPFAKTVLGWAGVLLLLAAAVWAARGLGWVSWPR